MKVLFIGGTGAISAHCSRLFMQEGIDLWVLNRGNRLWRIPNTVNFIQGDFDFDQPRLDALLKEHSWDCVINWNVYNSDQAYRDIKLFQNKTKQYIFISSTAVYKGFDNDHKITENSPLGNDTWLYAAGKLASEKIFLKAYKKEGFPVTIVRPGHTYCEFTLPTNIMGLGYGLVELIMSKKEIVVHNNGKSFWTLTHSQDFALGLLGLVSLESSIGEVFHITSDEVLSWLDIFSLYSQFLDIELKPVFIPSKVIYEFDKNMGIYFLTHKDKNMIYNNDKIKSHLGNYKAAISFKQGLAMSLEWHKENSDKIFYNRDVLEKTIDLAAFYKGKKTNVA